jgi:4-hydroxy-tetrahydrodipicolinate synthase
MVTKASNPFAGVWTALATPFTASLDIDWKAFELLLEQQVKAGIKGIVIAGTTGESPVLAVQEKLALIRKAKALVGNKMRIMAGAGDNNTNSSVELSRLSADAGADSLLIVTPPYNKPSTAGLIGHYAAISKAVTIPICLYHVPGRTAQTLSTAQITQIATEVNISSIKEASGDIAYFSRVVNALPIPILSGDDPTYLASLAVGGEGAISVASNVFPEAMVQMTDAYWRGDTVTALTIHKILMPAIDILFCEVNPCPLKAALHVVGTCSNSFRLPLAPVTTENYARIKKVIENTKQQLTDVLK